MKPLSSSSVAGVAVVVALALTLAVGGWLWTPDGVLMLQALGPGWQRPMQVFTFLGDEQFYLLFLPLVYWCVHKGLGLDLAFLLVFSAFTNTALKSLFKAPRPFWQNPGLQRVEVGGFGFPSGHAQLSASLFGRMARFRGRRELLIVMPLLIVLVAISRVYLGVHYPGDVVWGVAVGLVVLALYRRLGPALAARLHGLSWPAHLVLAALTTGILFGLVALMLAVPRGTVPGLAPLYEEAGREALKDGATGAGLLFGLWLGVVWEARRVRFGVAGPLGRRVLRYVLGVIGLLAIWLGLRLLFPTEPTALGLLLRVLRYAAAMFWAIGLWPWLFVRLGLGEGR
ncbi:MAG: phosphatase PAP2 family protein [Caldilineales bacterium]|nr:phosphatase PAP2 family protein [Caldilineales bacterium]MCX7852436.1 phosphatase PAP2 family protein [Caldilineales bacterium]